MALPGTARPIGAYRRLPSRSLALAGTARNSLACEIGRRKKEPGHEDRIIKARSLRHLYPRIHGPGARAGLQLARRPVRRFAGLYPQPSARWLDADPIQV